MRIIKLLGEITSEAMNSIAYFIHKNLMNFVNILSYLLLPYIMYIIGQVVSNDRGCIAIGGEVIIPVVILIISYYLKTIANKTGKGINIPIPNKRFTTVDDDGEVNVEFNRVQELILYMADLEDWLKRKGLTK